MNQRSVLAAALVVFLCALLVTASIPTVPTGTWKPWNPMGSDRSGAASVLLPDGRVLITGGSDTNGALASVEVFSTAGSFSSGQSMHAARSAHTATVLQDGRVLVTGGTTAGGGFTNTAETYDPSSDLWTLLSATLLDARSGQTASLLPDGRVLIAGGQNSTGPLNTVEVFDPSNNSFSNVGVMTSPRINHSAAELSDGRVLFIGGSDGTNALNSVDIFDPSSGAISQGPALSTPRVSATASITLDGKVVVIGGNDGSADLSSIEIFDPASGQFAPSQSQLTTARSTHTAFLLPNNNSILLVGGSSAGTPLNSAELYLPWADAVQSTGAMSVTRSGLTASALSVDGTLLAAGGSGLSSAELYGFATVKTDAADYPPGTTVNITGSGWQPGETVTLSLLEVPSLDSHGPYTAIADANGNIANSQFVTNALDAGIRFYLTAVGSQSGVQAQNTFTDAVTLNSIALGGQSPTPVVAGGQATYAVTVGFNGNSSTCSSLLSVTGLPSGATGSFNPNPVTSTGNPASSTLTVTTSASTPLGSSTFTAQAATPTGSGCNGQAKSTTANLTVNAQLAFGQQPTATAATSTISPVTVRITDSTGNTITTGPASTAAVTIAIGNNPSGGTLSGTATVNASGGIATFSNLSIDKAGTGYTLVASGTNLVSTTSTAFNINAGAAAKLAFTTSPGNSTASIAFPTQPVVTVQDAGGNTVTGSSAPIALAITSGTGTAGATLSCTTNPLNASSGIATFAGCKIDKPGTGYTLTATSAGLTLATSTAFNVNAGAATQLAFIQQPTNAVAGAAITPAVTVQVQDANGNAVTTSTASITVAIGTNPGGGTLSGTKTLNAVNGLATFTGLSIDKVGSGYTLTAASTGLTGATSSPFNITPGAANKLAFAQQPTSTAAAQIITPAVTLQIQDANGNLVTSSTASITVAIGTNPSSGTLSGTKTVAAAGGIATFNDLAIDKAGSGYTLTAASTGLTGATSSAFNITAGAATKLAFAQQPSNTQSGSSITPAVTVQVQDAGGNLVTSSTASITVAIGNNPASGTLSGTKTVNAVAGVATFSTLSIDKVGTGYTLTANSTGLTGASSGGFDISAGALHHFAFNTISSPQTAGTAFNITLTAEDVNNNTVTSYDGNGFKAVLTSTTGTLVGAPITTSAFTLGVLSQSVTITNTGTFTISAAGNGNNSNITGTSNSFTVNSGAPSKLAFAQQPSTTTAGQAITPAVTVQIQDANGNLTSSTANVTVGIGTNPSSGTLSGTTTVAAVAGVATFGNLSIDKGGVGYTLTAASSGLAGATSTAFTINNPAPTLTTISPTSGNLGQTLPVVFTGTNFIAGVSTVSLGADITVNTVTVNSSTQITANVTIPNNATVGPHNASVTNAAPGGGTATLTGAFTVNNPTTTTQVVSSLNPSNYGDQITFTATVSSQAGTPTGSVTFYDGGTCLAPGTLLSGPIALNGSGIASFSTSALNAGAHTIVGCYVHTGVFLDSSGSVGQQVNQAQATLSFGTLTFTYDGTPKPVSVTTSPLNLTGVTILYNGSPTPPTNAGSTPVTATLSNPNYTATPISGTEVIQPIAVTITITDPSPTYDGQPHAATISVSPNVTVAVTYNGIPTAPTAAGVYAVVVTVTAPNYSGTGNGQLTILQATPNISWTDPADITYGTALGSTQLNASTSVAGTFGYTPPAGTVLSAGPNQALSTTFTPTDTVDFATVTLAVHINVLKATPTIIWNNPADISYGTALGNAQLNAIALPPTSALTGWWRANGDAKDAVGSNDGTLVGGAAFSAGVTGQAFSFPNAAGDGVTIPSASGYDMNSPGFTASFWVQGTQNGAGLETIVEKSYDTSNHTGWAFQVDSSTGKLEFDVGQGTVSSQLFSTGSVLDGSFHHIVGTWDGASKISLYIDGALQGHTTLAGAPVNNSGGLTIGFSANGGNPQQYFMGAVDELQIFNQPLPAGSFTYTPPSGTQLNAGSGQTLSVNFDPTDQANLNSVPASVTINVTKANQTITFGALANQTYGNAPFTVSATGGGSGNAVTFTAAGACSSSGVDGSTITITGAGTCTVTADQAGDSNYNAATSVPQSFTVNAATLTASIVGDPTKPYDGNTTATLAPANFSLSGLVGTDAISVNKTSGTYNNANVATANTVTATLASSDFAPANGTVLSNYTLPTTATGPGHITAVALSAAIIGMPTKPYDGSSSATLTPANFALTGLASGESVSVTKPTGTYNSPDVTSAALVTATLASSDFTAGAGTTLGNYVLPTTASGPGQITAKTVTAAIIGDPTKPYDGNTGATLTAANFSLSGLVAGQSFTVTQTSGTYDSPNVATAGMVTASLAPGNFNAGTGTMASNYVLPSTAAGAGHITAKALSASIIGNPTKPYDGNTSATLAPANFSLSGLVGSDSFRVTQTSGTYNSPNVVMANTVTANLASSDFTPANGTVPANYTVPTAATGPGHITAVAPTVTVTDPMPTYDGNPHSAVAIAIGVDGHTAVTGSFTFTYDGSSTTPTNAKTSYAVVATFTSTDSNYTIATGNGVLTIKQASSTTTVTGGTFVYDGAAHPGSVSVAGAGGLSLTPAPTYSGGCISAPVNVSQTNPTACTASYSFAGDANHLPSSGSATITITPAPTTTIINPNSVTVTYDALPHGVSATVTGPGLNQSVPVTYTPGGSTVPVNAGTYTANASYAGDANHAGSSAAAASIIIGKASPTFTGLSSPMITLGTASTTLSGNIKAGSLVPPGTVTISVNNLTQVASINSATGAFSATFATGSFPVSSGYTISYSYTDNLDNNFNSTSSNGTLKVQYAPGGMCAGDVGHAIRQPINSDGSSVWKQRSTVPAKFAVCDVNGTSIGTPGVVTNFWLIKTISGTVVTYPDETPDSTTPDTAFRWDPTAQQWIYNISTKSPPVSTANITYVFAISLNDGTTIQFQFGLK